MQYGLLRSITPDEIAQYEQDGVIWLRHIIDSDWALKLGGAIDEIIADPRGHAVDFTSIAVAVSHADEVKGFQASGDFLEKEWGSPRQLNGQVLLDEGVNVEGTRGHYLSISSAFLMHPFVRRMAIKSPVSHIASILMRSSRVYLYDDQLLVKPPCTIEKTAWHQDLGYDHIQGEQVCGIRVPATRETSEMGPVQYVRGSHLPLRTYKVNYFISDVAHPQDSGEDIPKIEGHEHEFDIVTPCPEPGDVVVHHIRTLHGAAGNRSVTDARKAITFRYGGDDARFKRRRFAAPQEPSPLKDGEPLENAPNRHPLAWVSSLE